MSGTAAASGLVVFLLCVQVIQSQNDWKVTYTPTKICALKGSTAVIRCSYRYPYRTYMGYATVQKTLWFTKWKRNIPVDLRTDSKYSGRVEHSCEKNICTLRIRDVRESDSAEYKFMLITNQPGGRFTGSPGVTLSVTDLQVNAERSSFSSWADLTCVSSCQLPDDPSYIWYKNGQKVPAETSNSYSDYFNSAGSFSCAVKGQEAFSSPPVYGPKLPSVSVSPSGEIVEGSSVTLTCSSDANPAATYTWYKENKTLTDRQEAIYHLSPVSLSDSGNYYCKSENELGSIHSTSVHIDVVYPPKPPSVSVSPSGEIVEGSSVNLTCSSDANPAANYTWYKENEDSPKATGQIFIITVVRSGHSGNYHCEVQNKWGRHNSTLHLIVVSGPMKSVAAGSITAVLLVIIFLSAFLLIRRKMSSKQTAERPDNRTQLNMGLVHENPSAAVQRRRAEEQDDLCYASVSFSKHQEDPLYSNISPAQLNRHKNEEEEEEDSVEYTAVNCERASASPETRRPEDVEDPSALYSTVSKTARA